MTEDELLHFGIKGMKWGHRKVANGTQIKKARAKLKKRSAAYREQSKKLDSMAPGSAKRTAFEKKLARQHQAYLKDPARVIAARMTRGEKVSSLLLSGSPLSTAATLGTIAATSAVSRRIEYKQQHGGYNKLPKGGPQKRIGFQRGRTAVVTGALLAPALLTVVGKTASSAIITKAAANRNAAKVLKPKAIGSAAQKIAYAAKRGGVHKITTLR